MATLRIAPDSDLAQLLRECAESGESLLIDTGDRVYQVTVRATMPRIPDTIDGSVKPDAVLGIIGIGASEEPTDISRHKRAYLAEAFDSTRR
ncbi:MAG TPA: hypothetical protein VMM78_00795 [Thermomicrobiales bacterium]|nr:hypothetical protein [Thermomicrobiales bacterium]